MVNNPSANHAVKGKYQKISQDCDGADKSEFWVDRAKGPIGVGTCISAQGLFCDEKTHPYKNRHDQVEQDEGATTIHPGQVGESPYVA